MEPLDVLHEIVAADKAARKRVADAQMERNSFAERLEELRLRIAETEMAHADEDIAAARIEAEKAMEKEQTEIKRACDENIDALKQRFEQRKEEGVEKLFRMVVGLDD